MWRPCIHTKPKKNLFNRELLGKDYTLSHYTEDGISETKSSDSIVCLNSKIAYFYECE